MMTDWLGGYAATWEVRRVNPDTWEDAGILENVLSVSVERSCDGKAPTLESGTMTIDAPSIEPAWYRISMIAEQSGKERVPIATLLFERASSHIERENVELECTGRSVLQPVADIKIVTDKFAPEGVNGAEYAAQLVRACTPAPVIVDGSFTLVNDIVFNPGCKYLDAVWQLLDAANWCMQIFGDGTIRIGAKPSEPALELSKANTGLLVPGVDDDYNTVDVPNRYYAIDDDKMAMAVNEDPDSKVSYPSRGRWVDEYDTSPVLVDGESLEMYAMRKLAEKSTVLRKFSYTREYWPDVVPYSLVRAYLPSEGVQGDLRVVSQTIECGLGAKVSEVAGMEVMA